VRQETADRVTENAPREDIPHRHASARRQQWLAAAVAAAVLMSGLNALVQVGKAAADYGCRHGWVAGECRPPPDRH
jgi:hypothetical protein